MKRDKSNPVAKNLNKYNRPATHTDRKKAMKKGKVKHQKSILKDDEQQTDTSNRTNSAAKKPQNYVDPVTGKTKTRMVPVHKDVQTEKLNPSDGIRTYIDDFQKSDAPQFQGKSKEKRKEMAIAAYLDAKRGGGEEVQNESTDAYGKSQSNIRRKNKNAGISSSDKNKLGKLSDLMKKQKKEEVEQVDEAKAPSTVKHKGKTYYSTGKQGKDIKTGAPSFEYSSDMDGNDERVFYNTKTRKVTRESVANESTAAYAKTQSNIRRKNKNAAITSSDKAKLGKLSALMKKQKREEVEQVDEVSSKKIDSYLKKSRIDKVKQYAKLTGKALTKDVGGPEVKKQLHKMNRRELGNLRAKERLNREEVEQVEEASQKLTNKRAELRKKMFGDANYLSPAQRKELDKAAKAALKKDSAAKKAAPAPKTTTKTAKGKTHTGRADPADQNIFMQFRKAQDAAKASGRKMHNIKVGPKSTVSVPSSLVNRALAKFDSLSKPEDKRRLKIQLIKALRAKAK